ncbi:DUF1266 domain-containing protein [Chitinophaga sp.]|uniref:DUF1266 domain-containing protein n=1 Tax=Chitinophaga sp. TaxID=1869181 RepID=UPI0031D433D8
MKTILTYLIIGFAVGYFVYTRVLPLFQKKKPPFTPVFRDPNSTLTEAQYKKVALGAIYSEMTHAYINTLATGLDRSYVVGTLLHSYWKLKTADEAIEKLKYLRDKGFRYYLPAIYKALMAKTEEEQELIMDDYFHDGEDYGKAFSQLHNLMDTMPELLQDGILQNEQDILKYGMIGWDCGRLVFLTRLCLEARIITEKTAWEYIDAANELAHITYTDWESYAKSYVLGRAMWGGVHSGNRDVAAIARYLLERADSPWRQLPW